MTDKQPNVVVTCELTYLFSALKDLLHPLERSGLARRQVSAHVEPKESVELGL